MLDGALFSVNTLTRVMLSPRNTESPPALPPTFQTKEKV